LVLTGHDMICILPTGQGKTACFAVPTLAMGWHTLVFSPLKALMRDQVQNLQRVGVLAAAMHSDQSEAENADALRRWQSGNLDIIYVAPERIRRDDFMQAMQWVKPDMIVVDECFSGDVELLTGKGFKDTSWNPLWSLRTAATHKGGVLKNKLPYEDRFRLMFQAAGSYHSKKSALFSFTKERKVKRFKAICGKLGLKYDRVKSIKSEKKSFIVNYGNLKISKLLHEVFDLSEFTQDYAISFVTELFMWAGSDMRTYKKPRSILYYASKEEHNTSFVQAVCVLAGFKSNQTVRKYNRPSTTDAMYRLSISLSTNTISAQSVEKSEVENPSSKVYCVEVPSGNIVVRRNGKPVVVGNCHTISDWSDNFRSAYAEVGDVVEALDPKVVAAFTATCPSKVEEDVRRVLRLPNAHKLIHYPRRENLKLSASQWEDYVELNNRLAAVDGSAIVYCATTTEVEKVYAALNSLGTFRNKVTYYHGKLASNVRSQNQDMFMSGEMQIVVATNAFGMGVDKPDIRAVIHRDFPGSIEAYSQEMGRAGRDGYDSICHLYDSRSAYRTQEFLIETSHPGEDAVRKVYNTLINLSGEQRYCQVSNKDLAISAQVDAVHVSAALQILTGAKVLARSDSDEALVSIRFVNSPEDGKLKEKYEEILEIVKDYGVKDKSSNMYQIDLGMLSEEFTLTSASLKKYLKTLGDDGYIMYRAPNRSKKTEITGDIKNVDFNRLTTKASEAHKKLHDVMKYIKTPDAEKHDFLEHYFEI